MDSQVARQELTAFRADLLDRQALDLRGKSSIRSRAATLIAGTSAAAALGGSQPVFHELIRQQPAYECLAGLVGVDAIACQQEIVD